MMPPNEPLSNEERELAAQLDRLAPRGGPSAEVDARILAASRAALETTPAARRSRPRWPVALGLAASMVVAVGIAWQLRLPDRVEMVASEAPSIQGASEQMAADDAYAPTASVMPPPAPSSARETASGTATQAAEGPPAGESAAFASDANQARAAAASKPQERYSEPPRAPSPTEARSSAVRSPSREEAAPPQAAPPAPPAPPAVVFNQVPPPTDAQASDALPFVPDPAPAESRESRAFMPDRPLESVAAPAMATGAERDSSGAAPSLDRIEVTGTRLRRTDLQVPVSEDALLDKDEWVERIRTRQGIGDEAAARRSLVLFVQAHSRKSVPVDLLPLLAE